MFNVVIKVANHMVGMMAQYININVSELGDCMVILGVPREEYTKICIFTKIEKKELIEALNGVSISYEVISWNEPVVIANGWRVTVTDAIKHLKDGAP